MHLPNTQRTLGEKWCLVLLQQASLIFFLSPGSLRKKKTSKNGSTIAGWNVL